MLDLHEKDAGDMDLWIALSFMFFFVTAGSDRVEIKYQNVQTEPVEIKDQHVQTKAASKEQSMYFVKLCLFYHNISEAVEGT